MATCFFFGELFFGVRDGMGNFADFDVDGFGDFLLEEDAPNREIVGERVAPLFEATAGLAAALTVLLGCAFFDTACFFVEDGVDGLVNESNKLIVGDRFAVLVGIVDFALGDEDFFG